MRYTLFGISWGFIFLAAGYDAYFAWEYRIAFQEWELNPLARWGARELGLPFIFAVKFVGIAFAACVAAFSQKARPKLSWPLTLSAVCVYGVLSLHYLADYSRHAPEDSFASVRLLASWQPGYGR